MTDVKLHRRCSECSDHILKDDSRAITCSTKCRTARSRRLRRESGILPEVDPNHPKTAALLKPHQRELADAIDQNRDDAIHDALQTELRPVVREAITDEVLRSIQDAVGLVPSALAAIEADLGSDDKPLRHRAATLLLKYTLGHPALVPSEEADNAKQPIVINFAGMSRPGHEIEGTAVEVEEAAVVEPSDEADDVRECDTCHATKPDSQFIENSDRCVDCYEKQQQRQRELIEETA